MKKDKPIFLVEDDEVDVMSVKRALRDLNVLNKLYIAGNGEEALEILRNPENERPSIILLDINMPRMNGMEFLKIVKQDQDLRTIPVIMLTTSRADIERNESFFTGAAGYMVKPVEYKQFVEVMRAINVYWTLSELPE